MCYYDTMCQYLLLNKKPEDFAITALKVMVNPLPKDKFLDWSKLKAFADVKINVTQKLKFVLGRLENIVGKEENAGYQHFLLFPQFF